MTDDNVKLNKMDKKHGSTVGRPRKNVVKSPKKNAPDSGDVSNIDYCACKDYKDEELSLECDSCHKYWHLCCVGLKGMDMNMVALLANWKCRDCFTCPHSYLDRPSMPSSVKVMVRDELHAIQPMIKATVEDAVRNVMSNTVCSKKDIKDVVKSYAAATQESQNKVIQQAAVAQSSKTVVESVVRQLDADKVEREKRRCNFVVLSAPEPKKESSTEEKRKKDRQFCSRVLEIPLTDIEYFLIGRKFRVSVNGQFSSFKKILSGIPQGSVIGPLRFILFINDLPECSKSTVKIFVDDLKLIANLSDKTVVDNNLKSLEDWESKWLLEFNIE
ncbi:hypothetical protein ACHWQZ_G008082 [Mnemiopsis leidyi]